MVKTGCDVTSLQAACDGSPSFLALSTSYLISLTVNIVPISNSSIIPSRVVIPNHFIRLFTMAPKKGIKIRGRGAAQAPSLSRPTIAGGPPSQFAPPGGLGPLGVNLSWQTPVTQAPRAAQGSTSASRGAPGAPRRGRGRGRGGRGGSSGILNGSTGLSPAPQPPTAPKPAEIGAISKGQKQPHKAAPEIPSSLWVTLRLPSNRLKRFPLSNEKQNSLNNKKQDRLWRKESASESFLTLKTRQRGVAGQHSRQDPPNPPILQSSFSPQSQESPLPSLISVTTSTPDFGVDLGPQTPLESQLSIQPTVARVASGPGNRPITLSESIASPKTRLISTQGCQHLGELRGPPSKKLFSATEASPGPHPMAPIKDTTGVQAGINDVIQNLYDIQAQTHGYVPETADLLVDKMTDLAQSLNRLQHMTSTTTSPNNPIHSVRIAPEIVDYVDDGRNPDIFTRDFVENVQRGNAVINGKQKAFRDFSEVFAQVLKTRMPELTRHVDRVMDNAGFDTEDIKDANKPDIMNGPQQNGGIGDPRQQDSDMPPSTKEEQR